MVNEGERTTVSFILKDFYIFKMVRNWPSVFKNSQLAGTVVGVKFYKNDRISSKNLVFRKKNRPQFPSLWQGLMVYKEQDFFDRFDKALHKNFNHRLNAHSKFETFCPFWASSLLFLDFFFTCYTLLCVFLRFFYGWKT